MEDVRVKRRTALLFIARHRRNTKRLGRFGSDDIYGLGVTTAKGKIIRVETLDPEIDTVLDRLFPDLGDANTDAWSQLC